MANNAGRPARDPGGQPAKLVPIRLTAAEHAAYRQAAARAGLTLSAWMRDRLDKAAKREANRD